MEKKELLSEVSRLAMAKGVSKAELVEAFERGSHAGGGEFLGKKVSMGNVLYFVGGGVVVMGVTVLIWQNWSFLNDVTRILATLGVGIAAYVCGVVLSRNEKFDIMGQAFHLIGALVLPVGLFVTLDIGNVNVSSDWVQTLVVALLLSIYLGSYFLFRKNIFLLFSIIFGTSLFFLITDALLLSDASYIPVPENWYEYHVLVTGLTYLLLGYSFTATPRRVLCGALYSFGILFFLGAALALGGWSPDQSVLWELLFPVLVFATLYASVQLKNKTFLVFGSLYLMAYIVKITAEYFEDNLGWPLALVLAGFALIATGYLMIYLNKKYLKT